MEPINSIPHEDAQLELQANEILRLHGRPKDKLAKSKAAIVEAHVPSIVEEGHLCHTLLTVLPDPSLALVAAWRAIPQVLAVLEALLIDLPGLYLALTALEVHGGSRPKKAKRAAPGERFEDIAEDAEEEGAEETGAAAATGGGGVPQGRFQRKGLHGMPHIHCLVYYPKQTSPHLDHSFVKRLLLERFPKADVNQVMQGRGTRTLPVRTSIVRAHCYVLKGVGCTLCANLWSLLIPHPPTEAPPPVKATLGKALELGSPPGRRTNIYLRKIEMIELDQDLPPEPEDSYAFVQGPRVSGATRSMVLLGTYLTSLGLRRCDTMWYKLRPNTMCVWDRCYDQDGLLRVLSEDPVICDILVNYRAHLTHWFKLSNFPVIDSTVERFRYLEFADCIYDIRTGTYPDKSDNFYCFDFYPITKHTHVMTEPTHWLQLISWQFRHTGNQTSFDNFISDSASILRLRQPKQPIPCLIGPSNTGKSTLIRWITRLYPDQAIGFINNSIAALSGIPDKQVLICDEFKTNMISRSDFLRLTDGSTGLVTRHMGQDAVYHKTMLMPQIYTANRIEDFQYKNDFSGAVENRIRVHLINEPIPTPSPAKAQLIYDETIFIVGYLNRYIANKQTTTI